MYFNDIFYACGRWGIKNDRWTFIKPDFQKNDFWALGGDPTRYLLIIDYTLKSLSYRDSDNELRRKSDIFVAYSVATIC